MIFYTQGKHVNTVMYNRVIGLSVEELKSIPCVIAIAAESTKSMAILGALRTGGINVIAISAHNIRTILSMTDNVR